MEQISNISAFNHFFLTMIILITMVLVSRTVVAGTKYSSILVIVVFGLLMGFLLEKSEMATPGLNEFPVVVLASKTTIIALIASFFVGGQELKRMFFKQKLKMEDILIPSEEETILGTNRTQFFFIVRAFFILIGIETTYVLISGVAGKEFLGNSYLLLAYVNLVLATIFIDNKAKLARRQTYIRKGFLEIVVIILVLMLSYQAASLIEPVIALPQIFFAMLISATLGMFFSNWQLGPTLNSLLFAGIPIVLAGSFLVGGSRMAEAFTIPGVNTVMIYGFTGQVFWMFSGLAILIFLGKANHLRNLAPGMAGGLSHSGITGACTAGDFGEKAALRAPIMINIPFFGHVFVFSILAASAERGSILVYWTLPLIVVGIALVAQACRHLRKAQGDDALEITGLMHFSLGWQIVAVFGSFTLLNMVGMPLDHVSLAVASALSHFGLFAAIQDGMFGDAAAGLIAFIFAMPFLVHPLVFGMFGKAAEKDGSMAANVVLGLALLGLVGIVYSLLTV